MSCVDLVDESLSAKTFVSLLVERYTTSSVQIPNKSNALLRCAKREDPLVFGQR
jgi:hypothetical protein